MLDKDTLRSLFDYNHEVGSLVWKNSPNARTPAGSELGCVAKNGYVVTLINRKNYQVHRLVWAYFNNETPKMLDHINRDKQDNRIENLRPCSNVENGRNMGISKNNKTGKKGVSWCSRSEKYQVTCRVLGKKKWLGYFIDLDEAAKAYELYAAKLHGEFYSGDKRLC